MQVDDFLDDNAARELTMADLKTELTDDPLTRGYAGMTDQQAADDLNTAYRTRNRTNMTGDEIAQQADPVEFNGLDDGSANNTADVKAHWLALCARESIDPFAATNEQLVIAIFGAGSASVANLQAARLESITRAQELGLRVTRSAVEGARA